MALAPVDPITRQRLILVRQLFQRALIDAERFASPVSRILAVVGFDLAVETAMKAAVIALQKAKAPARDFPGVLQQCEVLFADAGLGGFPDRANVLHVHDVRNDAQHKARYPSVSEVNDCRTYARDALQKLVEIVFQTDLASVSVSDLIADEGVRAFAQEADAALAEGKWRDAASSSAAVVAMTLAHVQDALVGRAAPFVRGIMVDTGRGAEADRNILRSFERMQRTLLLVVLGVSYADYMQFREIAGEAHAVFGEGRPAVVGGMEDPTAADAEFAVSFATQFAVDIEAQVGTLQSPFGRDYWL